MHRSWESFAPVSIEIRNEGEYGDEGETQGTRAVFPWVSVRVCLQGGTSRCLTVAWAAVSAFHPWQVHRDDAPTEALAMEL